MSSPRDETLDRRALLCPGAHALERGPDPERLVVAVAAGDDLEADRESLPAPAGRDREGRALADEVELGRHVEPVVEAVSAVPGPDGVVLLHRPRNLRHRGAEERVVALEDRRELLPGLRPDKLQSLELGGAERESGLHELDDVRVHA